VSKENMYKRNCDEQPKEGKGSLAGEDYELVRTRDQSKKVKQVAVKERSAIESRRKRYFKYPNYPFRSSARRLGK